MLNKLDLLDEADGEPLVEAFADAVARGELPPDARRGCATSTRRPYVLGLSCATGAGVASLRGALERVLGEARVRRSRPAPARTSWPTTCSTARVRASGSSGSCATTASCASPAARSSSLVDKLDLTTPRACARSRSSWAASA